MDMLQCINNHSRISLFTEDFTLNDTIVIYSGRFQPFHRGHKAVYKQLCNAYGEDYVYVCTSYKVKEGSPFNFEQKKTMMLFAGIKPTQIVKSSQPYRAKEIVDQYDPYTTRVLFAVSDKDMKKDPRFSYKIKKDGKSSYFQPMTEDINTLLPMNEHGYIITVPTYDFDVLGKPMSSASEIRTHYAIADASTKRVIIAELYEAYDKGIHEIMNLI